MPGGSVRTAYVTVEIHLSHTQKMNITLQMMQSFQQFLSTKRIFTEMHSIMCGAGIKFNCVATESGGMHTVRRQGMYPK